MSAVLRLSARNLAELALEGTVSLRLAERMQMMTGRRTSAAELRSWDASLGVLANDLLDAGLDALEVLLEYQLPLSSRRIDALVAGVDARTGRSTYLVVELKQWSAAVAFEGNPELVQVRDARGLRANPLRQVAGYCDYLRRFTVSLRDRPEAVSGVAYLHNAQDRDVRELMDPAGREGALLFTGGARGEWLDHLRSTFAREPGAEAADHLLSSAVAPSQQLLSSAADELQRREQFVLLDAQRVAYELVMHQVHMAREADHKRVVIVTGGPGSGKSVVALSVLGQLAREGRAVLHATGSRSFTQTLRRVAGNRSGSTQLLFKYFNDFMAADRNGLDVLILDEAHRLRETSVSRWTPKQHRVNARKQVDELIAAARVPVFLLDEHQVVRPGEMGTVAAIEAHARAAGHEIVRVDLDLQFRCGGSEAYVRWVHGLLGLGAGADSWAGDENFVVRTVESPTEMVERLERHLAEGDGARITAGYCWPWSDPTKDGELVDDVVIGSWSRPWNLKGDRSVGGAPPAALWASQEGGFGQVGCVYTAQGFEYDWNGVIFGPDLVRRGDRWIAQRAENRDPDFRNRKTVSDEEFEALVRNVYKVLLTRGMKGTYVYSVDGETQAHLRRVVSGSVVSSVR